VRIIASYSLFERSRGLANPTLDRMRRVMSLVYKHGQRYGLIPRNQESNPMRFVRCKTHMDMRPSGLAEKQSLERPGAAASFAGRIHVSLKT
jgi:hypothetical protein